MIKIEVVRVKTLTACRESQRRILSLADEVEQPQPDPSTFTQIAEVNAPFLSWDFPLHDARAAEMGLITRSFRGLGREVYLLR